MQRGYLRYAVRDSYSGPSTPGSAARRLLIGRNWSGRRWTILQLGASGSVFGVLSVLAMVRAEAVPELILGACLLLVACGSLGLAARTGLTRHTIELEPGSIRIVRGWLLASTRGVASSAVRAVQAAPRPWTPFERLAAPLLTQSAGREQPHTVMLRLADGSSLDARLSLTPEDAERLAADLASAVEGATMA